jgi:F-box/WD-40 domain protein MET30
LAFANTTSQELGNLSQSDQQSITHVWSIFSAAPAKQRNLILQGILSACCFPQLSFLSLALKDMINIDFLALLPPELGFKILCYLDTTSLCQASQVSRRWRLLADDDVVWHKMCEQHIDRKCTKCGWGLPLLERKRLRQEKRALQLRATGRGMNEWSPDITPIPESLPTTPDASAESETSKKRPLDSGLPSPEFSHKRICARPAYSEPQAKAITKQPWKDVYKARFKVGTNWKYGRTTSVKILKGHTNGITCLQYRDNILCTGSYDSTIRIWDMEEGKVIRILDGHDEGVRCLQFNDKQLVSGGLDGTVRIWDWTTGEPIREPLRAGLAPAPGTTPKGVLGVHFDGPYLAAGSMDNNVYIWNTQTKRTYPLRGHTDFVNSVKIDLQSRTVFSASDDQTVCLWDLETRQPIRIFKGHTGQVQQVILLPREFDADESDFADYVPDYDTDTDLEDEHSRDHVHIHDDSDDMDGRNAYTQPGAKSDPRKSSYTPPPLTNPPLFPDEPDRANPPEYMLTAGLDSTIRLWHVPTGRCLRTFFGELKPCNPVTYQS